MVRASQSVLGMFFYQAMGDAGYEGRGRYFYAFHGGPGASK